MSDDLDLGGIDPRHEPDPQFRAALHRRLVAIVEGSDPAGVAESVDVTTIELEPARRRAEPRRRNRWIALGGIAIASAAVIVAAIAIVRSRDHSCGKAHHLDRSPSWIPPELTRSVPHSRPTAGGSCTGRQQETRAATQPSSSPT
jgi:hypothetical protein